MMDRNPRIPLYPGLDKRIREFSVSKHSLKNRRSWDKVIGAFTRIMQPSLGELKCSGSCEHVSVDGPEKASYLNVRYHIDPFQEHFGGRMMHRGGFVLGKLKKKYETEPTITVLDLRFNEKLYFDQPSALGVNELKEGARARDLLFRISGENHIYLISLSAKRMKIGGEQVGILCKPDGSSADEVVEAKLLLKFPTKSQLAYATPEKLTGREADRAIGALTRERPMLRAYVNVNLKI